MRSSPSFKKYFLEKLPPWLHAPEMPARRVRLAADRQRMVLPKLKRSSRKFFFTPFSAIARAVYAVDKLSILCSLLDVPFVSFLLPRFGMSKSDRLLNVSRPSSNAHLTACPHRARHPKALILNDLGTCLSPFWTIFANTFRLRRFI